MNKVRVEEYQRWLDKFTAAQAHVSHIIILNLVNCARLHDVDGISFIDAKQKNAPPHQKVERGYK
jgi:hypothetical protein